MVDALFTESPHWGGATHTSKWDGPAADDQFMGLPHRGITHTIKWDGPVAVGSLTGSPHVGITHT